MYLCLFEDQLIEHLSPLTQTRAVYDLRVGVHTIGEALQEAFGGANIFVHCRRSVRSVTVQEHNWLARVPAGLGVLFVNGRYVVEEGEVLNRLRKAAKPGEPGRLFMQGQDVVAAWVPEARGSLIADEYLSAETFRDLPVEEISGARMVSRLWHLLDALRPTIEAEFQRLTGGYRVYERTEVKIGPGVVMVEPERIYLAPGAVVRPGAVLNAEDGPIYVGPGATVMEMAVVRGPVLVCEGAQVKIMADLEGVTVGPWCKVGGEVHDSILHSFSSKAHSGFMGNSYMGRWCNLGADSNTSNLRNDYGPVSLYNTYLGEEESTGRQFLGLFMADHAKCGINTMFNTGSVVGTFCNLYGGDFPPRCLPAFSWGNPQEKYVTYRLDKALKVAEAVMARRNRKLTEADREMLTAVYEATAPDRES